MDNNISDTIEKLKQRFLAESESNPELYHQIDIERVRTEKWSVERYVLDNTSEEEAYKELTRVMQWKNSFGLHERNDQYFPKEFYLIFGHEKYSRDKNGRLVVWNIADRYRKIADFSPLIIQFLCHLLEQLDRAAGPLGWVSVNDCTNSGMANVDLNMAKIRVEYLDNYPKGMQMSLNVQMPWILSSVFKIIRNFLNKKMRDSVILIKKDQLTDFVDKEHIPVCFGGQRECSIGDLKGLKELRECKHLGLNDKQIETFYNTYKDLF